MFRYADPHNEKKIFYEKKVFYWAPIDQYIGGPEHITMHLIYTRFYTKFLRDLKLLKFDEPALRYFTQGIVHGSDGEKMSKSRGNVVEPLETIEKYGADSLRFYLVSNGSHENDFDWNDSGMENSFRFIKKVFETISDFEFSEKDKAVESRLNKTIKEVTDYVENFKHNLALIKLREFFNYILERGADKNTIEDFLKMLHIYCPYLTEELWEKLGNENFISFEKWPISDDKKININFEIQEKAIEKLIQDINQVMKIVEEKTGAKKSKVFVYVLPNEIENYSANLDLLKKKMNSEIKIFAVNDKNKYDPENKSAKVRPGRPGIYLE